MPSWFDRFGQEWATTGLTDDPTYAQADAGWAFIGQAPPTVEQFNSMFQWSDDKDNWLYGQIGNVITSAGMVPDPNDLTQLLRAITSKLKIKLTGAYVLWVDAINGNDNNTGAQGSPLRTIQHAIDWTMENIEPAHNWVYIQLQPGTYEPASMTSAFNGGIVIQGDTANPRSYLIKNTNGVCVQTAYGGWLIIQGVSFEAIGNDTDYDTAGCALVASAGGAILFKDVAFGPCSNAHMWSAGAGNISSWGGINYIIYGGARMHIFSSNAGCSTIVSCVATIQNNPVFSIGFTCALVGGYIQSWLFSFIGTAQCKHAYADSYGILNTGNINPDTHYPGNAPAVYFRGGMYA